MTSITRNTTSHGAPGSVWFHDISSALSRDIVVELRKDLLDRGLDAGAHTISFYLIKRHGTAPSVATIWRILSRQGVVTPQPQKRLRSS